MLTEQALRSDPLWIKNIHEWDSILGQTRSEDDHFEVFSDFNYEFATAWADLYIDIASAAFYVDW